MKTCVVQLVTYFLLVAAGLPGPELVSQMTVGTRVVRGKDWDWGDQDGGAGSLGTVVRGPKDGWLQIEWDNGSGNSYRMGIENKYDLDLADSSMTKFTTTERSIPTNIKETIEISDPESGEIFKIGSRVVRGRDWEWSDQDGGEGNLGKIIAIDNLNKWVTVQWDLLGKEQYRMGHKGKFDIKLAPEDTETPTKPSDLMEVSQTLGPELARLMKFGTRVVRGRDWTWGDQDSGVSSEGTVVREVVDGWVKVEWDNGTTHSYRMGDSNKYELDLATSTSTTTKPKGTLSKDTDIDEISDKEQENLFKVGSRVVRGRDWDWDDEDGGDGNEGKIIAINFEHWATVEWDLGDRNQYRIGHRGYYDLKLAPETNNKANTVSMVTSARSPTPRPIRISTSTSRPEVISSTSTTRPEVTSSTLTKVAEVTSSTLTGIAEVTSSTQGAEVTSLKSTETGSHRSKSTKNDNIKELNTIFGLLISKEILRVPSNHRLQAYQEILEVFKKYTT